MERIASCVPSPLLPLFCCDSLLHFLSRNCAKWHVGSDATKRSSKNGVCRMDSELQSGSARRARYVRSSAGKRDVAVASRRYEAHDEYINEWAQIAAWPQQGGGSSRDAL